MKGMTQANHLLDPPLVAPLRGIIFDCDGVLFDSLESNRHFYNAILARIGLPPMTPAQEAYVHVHSVWECYAEIAPGVSRDTLRAAFKDLDYVKEIIPYMKPMPGLFGFLRWLRAQGMPMAVSTNRSTTMEMVTSVFELEPFFSPIMTPLKTRAKPHPESVHVIFNQWRRLMPDLQAHEVAFIGDSKVDQRTAEAAGLKFWAYDNPALRADLHVDCYGKLLAALTRVLDFQKDNDSLGL